MVIRSTDESLDKLPPASELTLTPSGVKESCFKDTNEISNLFYFFNFYHCLFSLQSCLNAKETLSGTGNCAQVHSVHSKC